MQWNVMALSRVSCGIIEYNWKVEHIQSTRIDVTIRLINRSEYLMDTLDLISALPGSQLHHLHISISFAYF